MSRMSGKPKKQSEKSGWFRMLARWSVAFVAIGVILYGAFDLWTFAHRSDLFLVRYVQVTGNHLLDQGEVLESLQVPARIRIWEVDPDALEARIEKLVWVQEAIVKRVLPHTLLVNVSERNPIADWVQPEGETRSVVDEEGVILCTAGELHKRLAAANDPDRPRRPEIRGLENIGDRPGDRLDSEGVSRLLSAYGVALARKEPWTRQVEAFEAMGKGNGWILRCFGSAREIRLGDRNFIERLGLLNSVYRFLDRERLAVAYVDLRFEEQGVLIGKNDLDPTQWLDIARRYPQPKGSEVRYETQLRT